MFMLSMGTKEKWRRMKTKILLVGCIVEITVDIVDHDGSHMGTTKTALIGDDGDVAAQTLHWILLGRRKMREKQMLLLMPLHEQSKAKTLPRKLLSAATSSWN